jgi:hypothetical protein
LGLAVVSVLKDNHSPVGRLGNCSAHGPICEVEKATC